MSRPGPASFLAIHSAACLRDLDPRIQFEPRSRVAVLAATAAFGLAQLLTDAFPPQVALLILLAGPAVAYAVRRGRGGFLNALSLTPAAASSSWNGSRAPAFVSGFAIVVAAICFLEVRDPYYFTQDDNLSMGPVVIAACRGVFEGDFPTWNPFQLLGQPTSVQSIYGLTYPLTYAVFALVRAIGHEAHWAEAFVILHILGGYVATYFAARQISVRPILAAAAGIAFVLSGTALMIARSYATMAPVLLWAPLLIILTERLRRLPVSWPWAVATAVVIGLFCHSGNAQMWVYALIFFGVAVITYTAAGEVRRESLSWVVVAALLSLAVCVFLVIPQMWFMKSVVRTGGGGHGIAEFLPAMLLPAPLASADHPEQWGDPANMAPLYYSGTVFTAVAFAGLLAMIGALLTCRGVRRLLYDNVWLICAGLALWTAFGTAGPWTTMSILPVLDKFNGPWKMLLFVQLLTAVGGALMLERMVSSTPSRRAAAAIVAAVSTALVVYNVTQTRSAFYDYGDDPYPALPAEMTAVLKAGDPAIQGRVLPIAPERSRAPGYVTSLMLDFPSYYEIASMDGYDPFVRSTVQFRQAWSRLMSEPRAAARAYGVRWLLIHRTAVVPPPLLPGRSRTRLEMLSNDRLQIATALSGAARMRLALPDLTLYELPPPDPLAFAPGSRRALPVTLRQNGLDVDVRDRGPEASVIVNVLFLPGMNATVGDGRPAAITADSWGRVLVKLPDRSNQLHLRFEPPWGRAAATASCLTLLAAIVAWYARSRSNGSTGETGAGTPSSHSEKLLRG